MILGTAVQFKMVLVGDSAVGKSSILNRFVDDQFQDGLLSTIGVDFKFRKIKIGKNQQVKLQIWDTAGQQAFRAIVSAYYNSADAIVIVYDITSEKSFESVQEYWIKEAENFNKNNSLVFLMGNKLDEANRRTVEHFSIEGLLDEHKIFSAKSGENIEDSFINLTKKLIQAKNPHQSEQKNMKLEKNNQGEPSEENRASKCCLK